MEKRGYLPLTVSVLWRSLLWVSAVGLMVLASDPAHASRLRRANVVLEGYVGQAPAGVRSIAQLVLQSGGDTYQFALTRALAVPGNCSGRQLLEDIRPFQNTLVLRGSASTLSGLVNASPGPEAGHQRLSRHRHAHLARQPHRARAAGPNPGPGAPLIWSSWRWRPRPLGPGLFRVRAARAGAGAPARRHTRTSG